MRARFYSAATEQINLGQWAVLWPTGKQKYVGQNFLHHQF
jgi:hypothetical protein